MKIAHFTDAFYPQINGVVTSVISTVKCLAKKGHQILLFAPYSKGIDLSEFNQYSNIEIKLLKGVRAFFYPDVKFTLPYDIKIYNKLKKEDIDIIHFHAPFTLGAQAIINAKLLKKPLIGTFHTFIAEDEYLKIVKLDKIKIAKTIGWQYLKRYYNRCDIVISPAEFTANNLKENKLKSRVEIVKNGIFPIQTKEVSQKEIKEFKEKYNINTDKILLYVGRLSKEKSVDILIKAVAVLKKKFNDIKLLIVGDGPDRSELELFAKLKEVNNNVIFTGKIEHNKLLNSPIYHIAKIFVTASKSENQPMTLIEAMNFSLPIIGVNSRGIPEMIDGNGFICENDNYAEFVLYILELLTNDKLYNEMSKRSKELSITYDICHVTDKLIDIYKEVIDKYKSK